MKTGVCGIRKRRRGGGGGALLQIFFVFLKLSRTRARARRTHMYIYTHTTAGKFVPALTEVKTDACGSSCLCNGNGGAFSCQKVAARCTPCPSGSTAVSSPATCCPTCVPTTINVCKEDGQTYKRVRNNCDAQRLEYRTERISFASHYRIAIRARARSKRTARSRRHARRSHASSSMNAKKLLDWRYTSATKNKKKTAIVSARRCVVDEKKYQLMLFVSCVRARVCVAAMRTLPMREAG